MRKTSIVALLLGLLLTWRAGASAVELVRGLSAEALLSLRLSREERFQRALGDDYELYRTLSERTPADARIFFLAEREVGAVAFSRLQVLLYPRRVFPLERPPERWRPEAAGLDDRVFLLEYAALHAADWEAWWSGVAETDRFRLWRFRPPERRGDGL